MSSHQATVQEVSKEYVSQLESCDSEFKTSIKLFLASDIKRCLVIETKYTRVFAVRIKATLSELNDDNKTQKALKTYLNEKNQTFLCWKKFLDLVGAVGKLPRLTSLSILEFSGQADFKKEDVELLNKIIETLKVDNSKKVILITSQQDILDERLKYVKIISYPYIDELRKNNIRSTDKCKALMEKSSKGDANAVAKLLKTDLNVNVVYGLAKSTALHVASEKGHEDVISTLLKNGAYHLRNNSKDTPLHLAARNGHDDVVLLLIKNRANVNLRNRSGRTALHLAVANDHKKVVETLLEHRANINALTCDDLTSLYIATINNNIGLVKILLQRDAQLLYTKSKDTALHLAAREGYREIVELLLERNIDVGIKSCGGWTALHHAVFNARDFVAEALLKHGINSNVQNSHGLAPLHMAVLKNNTHVLMMLLRYGADINIKYSMGNTPLHYAALHNRDEAAQLLLENGAKVDVKNKNGKTALDLAVEHHFVRVVAWLTNKS